MITLSPPYKKLMLFWLICSLIFINLEVYGYFHSTPPAYSVRTANHIHNQNIAIPPFIKIANKNRQEDLKAYAKKDGIIEKRVEQSLDKKRYLLQAKDAYGENMLKKSFNWRPEEIYVSDAANRPNFGKYLDRNGKISDWNEQEKYKRAKENLKLTMPDKNTHYPHSNVFLTDKVKKDQTLNRFNPYYHKEDKKSSSLVKKSLPDYFSNADINQLLQHLKTKNKEVRSINSRKKYDKQNGYGDFDEKFTSKHITFKPTNVLNRFQEETITKADSQPQDFSQFSLKYVDDNMDEYREPTKSWKGGRKNNAISGSQLFSQRIHDFNSGKNKMFINKRAQLDVVSRVKDNYRRFSKTYFTKHPKDFRNAEKEIHPKYLKKHPITTTDKQMSTNGSHGLSLFRKNLKVLNQTADLQTSFNNNDSFQVQIYHSHSKNMLDRQRKELKAASLATNVKTVRDKRSEKEESYVYILKMLGLGVFLIIIVACIACCINNWKKNKKWRKNDKIKEKKEDSNYTDEVDLNKASSQPILKQNERYIGSFKSKNENYTDETCISIAPINRKEEPVFDAGESRHESIESVTRSKSNRQTVSLPSDVGMNYPIKKPSYQDVSPQIRPDFENVIEDKSHIFESSIDSSHRSSEGFDNATHHIKKRYLSLEESTSNKERKLPEFFDNNIRYMDDSYAYNAVDLGYVKPNPENNDSEEVLSEVIVENGQHYLAYEDDINVSAENSEKYRNVRNSSMEQQKSNLKQSKDNLGIVYFDNGSKLSSSSASEQYSPSSSGNTELEKIFDRNISDASDILYSSDENENRIGSPWERNILNVKPICSQLCGKHDIKKNNSEIKQQKAIPQQSKRSLDSVKSEEDDEYEQRSSPDSYPSQKVNRDIRNETLKMNREKKGWARYHPWKNIIDDLKRSSRFNRPMIVTKFMM